MKASLHEYDPILQGDCTCKAGTPSDAPCCPKDKDAVCPCQAPINACSCRQVRSKVGNLDNQCMAHQNVIIFGDYHGIQQLSELACRKIMAALQTNTDFNPAPVVTKLLSNTCQLSSISILEPVLLLYAARTRWLLWRCPGFRKLVKDTPSLSYGLLEQSIQNKESEEFEMLLKKRKAMDRTFW